MDSTLASHYGTFPSNTTLFAPLQIQVKFKFSNVHIVHICVKHFIQTLLSRVAWPFNVFRSPNLCEGSLLLRSCNHPLRFHISSTYQVWGQFDNYLLTSVILIAVAIILLMLYISCYAWVFRVSYLRYWPSSFSLPKGK